jgi:hypothetical protein
MSRTKRPLRITDSNQACFTEMGTCGLQEESEALPHGKDVTFVHRGKQKIG